MTRILKVFAHAGEQRALGAFGTVIAHYVTTFNLKASGKGKTICKSLITRRCG